MRKNKLLIALCGALTIVSLAGCGAAKEDVSIETESADAVVSSVETEVVEKMIPAPAGTVLQGEYTISEPQKSDRGESAYREMNGKLLFSDATYVMIYNPLIYDARNPDAAGRTSMTTGHIGSQILTGMQRGEGLEEKEFPFLDRAPEITDFEAGNRKPGEVYRGSVLEPIYHLGDHHSFFYGPVYKERVKGDFEVVYEGKHCYIWSVNGSMTRARAQEYGKCFDDDIYEKDVQTFGTVRFAENDGKINILMYDMTDAGYGGFFWAIDAYSSEELSAAQAEAWTYNLDHAILNINCTMDFDYTLTTLSHELQHAICFSSGIKNSYRNMAMWIDESMSSNAEEIVYPETKVAYNIYRNAYESGRYRSGQSLYNFAADYTGKVDIGAYGIVFLFEHYMRDLCGDSFFAGLHDFWRNCGDADMTEMKALYETVPNQLKSRIESTYSYERYGLEKALRDKADIFTSKMTLDFWISTAKCKQIYTDIVEKYYGHSPSRYKDWNSYFRAQMLYDSINPATIEGGGCIVVALKDGSFIVPDDASQGLVYIAFDDDFNMIGSSLGDVEEQRDESPTERFAWNGSRKILIATTALSQTSGLHYLFDGTEEYLMAAGMQETESLLLKDNNTRAESIGDRLHEKTDPVGVLILYYDPNDKDYDLEKVLADAYAEGVCVYTIGAGDILEDRMMWNVHYYSKSIGKYVTGKAISTSVNDSLRETGKAVGPYIVDVLNGNENQYFLYDK